MAALTGGAGGVGAGGTDHHRTQYLEYVQHSSNSFQSVVPLIVPHNAAGNNGFVDECKGNQGRTTVRPQARAPCDFVGDGGLDIPL